MRYLQVAYVDYWATPFTYDREKENWYTRSFFRYQGRRFSHFSCTQYINWYSSYHFEILHT